MNQQTKSTTHPLNGVWSSASALASDIVEIGELQVALAKEDTREAIRSSAAPAILLVVGVVGLIAGLPVLGLAFASWLIEVHGWSTWGAYLITGLGLIVAAMGSLVTGALGLRSALRTYTRSVNELSKNLNWLKSLLQSNQNK